MKRSDLTHAVRERLKRLPPSFEAHYDVVPLPPPEDGVVITPVQRQHSEANAALARVQTLAAELKDPYLVSRMLPRREAVSSSAMEGTNSTLDEPLSVEEIGDSDARDAATQVRDYALALDDLVPARARKGRRFSRRICCKSCTGESCAATRTAATQAIEQLMDAGILKERTGYARNRVFAAPEVLSVMNRPFGETPLLPAM